MPQFSFFVDELYGFVISSPLLRLRGRNMADRDIGASVPVWDGSAKTWRRYTKEVAWFVTSTPVHKRRYVASKLIGRLQGPARLLAMSWNRLEFDSQEGTLLFLRKLAASPLVRRTLPNTAAILQQYLAFRRRPGESMASFLVRETLGFEEFTEALNRLWEEQTGVDQAQLSFGLPPVVDEEWSWWYDEYDPTVQDQGPLRPPDVHEPSQELPGDDADSETAANVTAQTPSASAGAPRASVGSSPIAERFLVAFRLLPQHQFRLLVWLSMSCR